MENDLPIFLIDNIPMGPMSEKFRFPIKPKVITDSSAKPLLLSAVLTTIAMAQPKDCIHVLDMFQKEELPMIVRSQERRRLSLRSSRGTVVEVYGNTFVKRTSKIRLYSKWLAERCFTLR